MLCVLQVETNELVDLATCEPGRLVNNVWSGPKHVVTHEYVSKTNLRGSCRRYPHHKCPESLLQVEGAWYIVIGILLPLSEHQFVGGQSSFGLGSQPRQCDSKHCCGNSGQHWNFFVSKKNVPTTTTSFTTTFCKM